MTCTCPLPLLEASIHLGSSLTVTSGYPSDPFVLLKVPQAFVQMSYLQGTMIVNLCELSQPLREALPAPLAEVRQDVLYEAVSTFLLVPQQLLAFFHALPGT